MPRPTRLTIDLRALAANAQWVRSLAQGQRVMAAVKANAYGHGLIACANVLQPLVEAFAVACCEEATQLRQAGTTKPILVLEGPFDTADVIELTHLECWTVIHSREQLGWLREAKTAGTNPPSAIWLKVDTGMHRLGVSPEDVSNITDELRSLGVVDIVLATHLAHAESPDAPLTCRQLQRWQQVAQDWEGELSLLNSAGLTEIGMSQAQQRSLEWLRPGYMLYGGRTPSAGDKPPSQAVMAFDSRIMAIRTVSVGETVGYGGHWIAQRTSQIATIPVGYGDGYPRTAENGTPVLVENRRCPLAGRVSMDMITVDVTDCPAARVGSAVQLWGQELAVDEVARHANTIGYELLTRLPERVPRVFRSLSRY